MDLTLSTRSSRDDCWSEGATSALIEAWGNRYISVNRGNLRQKDWKEVADAVNARSNGLKPRRSDVQCKNRIDTLKKKYKVEKAKSPPSTWPFYDRLDSLIGSTTSATKKTNAVNLTVKSKPNPTRSGHPISTDSEDEDDDDDDVAFDERVVKKEHRMEDVDYSDGAACRELARAVLKLGEIYERIESAKQQQMMELEKQRMEFTKELEFERMNMIIEAQLEIEKRHLKRGRPESSSGKKP